MFEILGVVGIAISVTAHVPKVVHLARAPLRWRQQPRVGDGLAGDLLVGVRAVQRGKPVFILLKSAA
jgi:hypothetical protein